MQLPTDDNDILGPANLLALGPENRQDGPGLGSLRSKYLPKRLSHSDY